MKILIPAENNLRQNPYISQLLEALNAHQEVEFVGFGAAPLFWPRPQWDVLHIQWPEALFFWRRPSAEDLDRLEARLQRQRETGIVVSTVHNNEASGGLGEAGPLLYDLVYRLSDGFVHLGDVSRAQFVEQHGDSDWCQRAQHTVIPIGDYSFYDRFPEDRSLVRKSRSSKDTHIVLVFGALRSPAEELLAREAFQLAALENTHLVFAGPTMRDLTPEKVSALEATVDENIVRFHRHVDVEQVAPLLKAARVVFLPRRGRLNSAVVPLAFTYGIPVVGPDEGVIAEVIREGGGFVYRPGNKASAAKALARAMKLRGSRRNALRDQIRAYVDANLRWPTIAGRHLEFYRSLLDHRQQAPTPREPTNGA